MKTTRRTLLSSVLFGAGYLGLRSLATGLPIAVLAKGARRAFADGSATCANQSKAKYIILSTSAGGDPINANVPGMYNDANIAHSADPRMAATSLTLNGFATKAALPWASTTVGGSMPQWALDRTTFWHIQTNTPVHSNERNVLKLMGASSPSEMLPSILSNALAPCLGTLQPQPITVGAVGPSEGLSYQGQALPILPPVAVKETLVSPTGPLMSFQKVRDDTLSKIDDIYRNSATPAQSKYLDSLITTRQQVRNINTSLLDLLSGIPDNSVKSQIDVAIALIQMNVSPVIVVHIPFGGDNHVDAALTRETTEHLTGVASINYLMTQLQAKNLQDSVLFMSLNVFGRTIGANTIGGRNHNENLQTSITIGNTFKAGMVGAVMPVAGDYGAAPISSSSGAGGSGGDIAPADTLASFGKTMMAGLGLDTTAIGSLVSSGTVIQGALA